MQFLILWLFLGPASPQALARVRTVEVKQDQIVVVRTAIGIATIIQVPDRPSSLVLGDQGAFKVEYLDQAITIKPLHSSAKSNLYIYTDYRRYNVQLVTAGEAVADYVVYLEIPKEARAKKTTRWTTYSQKIQNAELEVRTHRVGKGPDGSLMVELSIASTAKEKFKPEWLWLTQGRQSRPIHRLLLSTLELRPGNRIDGELQILRSEISETLPLQIELRRKTTSILKIPKVSSWK